MKPASLHSVAEVEAGLVFCSVQFQITQDLCVGAKMSSDTWSMLIMSTKTDFRWNSSCHGHHCQQKKDCVIKPVLNWLTALLYWQKIRQILFLSLINGEIPACIIGLLWREILQTQLLLFFFFLFFLFTFLTEMRELVACKKKHVLFLLL